VPFNSRFSKFQKVLHSVCVYATVYTLPIRRREPIARWFAVNVGARGYVSLTPRADVNFKGFMGED
jgi:hypothetical protein